VAERAAPPYAEAEAPVVRLAAVVRLAPPVRQIVAELLALLARQDVAGSRRDPHGPA